MKLNRTGSNWTELERNKINENWDIIEGGYNDVVGKISDEVVGHLIDSAKLIWKEPVDTFGDLPTNAEVGETRMVREADPEGISYVYRFDGEKWEKIQEIDVTLVNEVDRRLTAQLAETDSFRGNESMINRKKPRPMITICDDDGNAGVYTKLKPLADEYNIKFTSALITSRIGEQRYLTEAQIKELRDSGRIEFISHGHLHDINNRHEDMTEEERLKDMRKSQQVLKRLGLNHRAMAYAFGTYTPEVVETARQVWDYCIGTGTQGPNLITPPFDNYDMRRTHGENNMSIVKLMIDRAANENGWLVLTTHVDQGTWYSEAYIRELIEYALDKGLEFVTTKEGYEAHGNVAQLSSSDSIAANGKAYGNILGRTIMDHSVDITGATDVRYFEDNAITHSRIGPNREGFPSSLSGMLETYKYDGHRVYSYQVFSTNRDKQVYYRSWDEDNNGWYPWENLVGGVVFDHDINITASTNVRDFKEDAITYSLINANRGGFPNDLSGILETYRMTHNRLWSYQKFIANRSGSIFYRSWDVDADSWADWIDITPKSFVLPQNSISIDTPITSFSRGITIVSLTVSNDFFPGVGGVVITYKAGDGRYSYQEFKQNGEFNHYIRHIKSENTWSEWRKYAFETI